MGAHVSVPMYQRTLPQRYRLVGLRCASCGMVIFPPKGACPACRGTDLREQALSGEGKLYSFTVIEGSAAPPEFSDQANAVGRYVVGVVELDEGPRVIAQVAAPPEGLELGMPVRAVLRRLYVQEGVIRYGYKFVPRARTGSGTA